MCILCVWCTCIVQSFSPRRLALGITRLSHDSGKRSVVDSNCKHFQNISQDDLGHGNVPHEAFDTMAHVKEYIHFHMRDVVICSWLTSVNIILLTHTPPTTVEKHHLRRCTIIFKVHINFSFMCIRHNKIAFPWWLKLYEVLLYPLPFDTLIKLYIACN